MDTGTHVVMGIALCSLATLDSNIYVTDATATAVIYGIMIGSQAPDIDTILKFKNNATYIRNHRGITHSLPAQVLWPIVISLLLKMFFWEANWMTLWIWSQLAVSFHIFVDLFNAYGTQALRPFSKKWVAFGIINTFDPIIFTLHIIGIFFWTIGFDAGKTFLNIYLLLTMYYIIRVIYHFILKHEVKKLYPTASKIVVIPTMRFLKFKLAFVANNCYYVGRIHGTSIHLLDKYRQQPLPKDELITAACQDENIAAFLSFSPIYRWELEYKDTIIEVRFIDLRYRSNTYYPFVAVVQLDEQLNILSSYTGWIFSEKKLQKKLVIN